MRVPPVAFNSHGAAVWARQYVLQLEQCRRPYRARLSTPTGACFALRRLATYVRVFMFALARLGAPMRAKCTHMRVACPFAHMGRCAHAPLCAAGVGDALLPGDGGDLRYVLRIVHSPVMEAAQRDC